MPRKVASRQSNEILRLRKLYKAGAPLDGIAELRRGAAEDGG